jgi:riboflavin kinase
MAEATQAVGPAERETLKELALAGAYGDRARLSCSDLGERLDVSTQTVSRRLQCLEEAGLVEREMVSDGQLVTATPGGEQVLSAEYADYRRIFETDPGVDLEGTVTSGMGEGRHYITLPGYMEQFRERLEYEPFAGTLNVELDEESVRARSGLDGLDPVVIDGWEGEDRTYGPAYCWPARVAAGDQNYESTHVIAPERTHHGRDQLELIAPVKLRDELDLADGDRVRVHVEE